MMPPPPARPSHRSRAEWIALGLALLIIGAFGAYNLHRDRRDIDAEQSDRLQAQARVVDENLLQQVQGVNTALVGVRDDFFTSIHVPGMMDMTSHRLRALTQALPGMRAMFVLDAQGTAVAAHSPAFLGRNDAHREYFTTARVSQDKNVLFVSLPFNSTAGAWVINLTRVILDAQGAFAGVATASLDPDYFNVTIGSVLYAPDMRATLLHGKGEVFLEMPQSAALTPGSASAPGWFFARHRNSGQTLTFFKGTAGAGDERMVASRTLQRADLPLNYPLVLQLSRNLDAMYAPWRGRALVWSAVYLMCAAGACLGLSLAQRRRGVFERFQAQARREREEAAKRLEAITNSLPALITHVDRDERYLFNNAYFGELFHVDHRELQGRTLREVGGEDVYRQLAPHIRTAFEGRPATFESEALVDGVKRHFHQNFVPDVAPDGSVQGLFSIAIDITDRKRAETLQAQSEERIRSILSHAPDAFIGMDSDGRVTEWNRQAETTFGWHREEALGKTLAELIVPPRMREAHITGLERFAVTGTGPEVNQRIEVDALRRDGSEVPVELSIGAARAGDAYVAMAFLHDITQRKEAEARTAATQRRLRDITNNLPVLISYIDKERRLQFCNETFRAWMGVDPAAAVGRLLLDVIGPTLYEQRRSALDRALAGERVSFDVESSALGITRQLQNVYIPDTQPDGSVAGIYTLSTDVTAVKEVERQLRQLARVDPLTGLPNRRHFDERLAEAIARSRRDRRPMALLVLDLDHFKQINDSRGHGAGDEVLREFASRLRQCVRGTDLVARLAGDEFVIILEGLRAVQEAESVAQKIATVLRPVFMVAGEQLAVTSSVGIAFLGGEPVSPDALLATADDALYRAKRAGRNTFAVTAT